MSILRTDLQTALNDLHVAVQQSADHYRDAAEFIDDSSTTELFNTIAGEREALEAALADAIRATGDLPADPDPEKEAGEQLIHRLRALFSAGQTADVLRQRLESESDLEQVLSDARALKPGDPFTDLGDRCQAQIESARERLKRALEQRD